MKVRQQKFVNLYRGFTLIELMVVIAVLGILFAVALISLNGVQKSARDSTRQSDIHNYYIAISHYYQDTHTYPAQKTIGGPDVSTLPPATSIFDSSTANPLSSGTSGSYMPKALHDPTDGVIGCQVSQGSSNSICQYSYYATPINFTLWAVLENPTNQGGVFYVNTNGIFNRATSVCSGANAAPCQ